jgi:hypothetical protein
LIHKQWNLEIVKNDSLPGGKKTNDWQVEIVFIQNFVHAKIDKSV